jgi:hypothetical protein
VTVKTETDFNVESETLSLTFDRPEIPLIFSSALLGGLLVVLQNTQKNVPLLVCSSSGFLSQALVKDRSRFEHDFLDPKFHLLRAVLATLNEWPKFISRKCQTIMLRSYRILTHGLSKWIQKSISCLNAQVYCFLKAHRDLFTRLYGLYNPDLSGKPHL